MITQIYAHILDEDRRVNAQRFEDAFYTPTDLRTVKAPTEPGAAPASTEEIANLVLQLQQNPELLKTLSALLNAGK